MTMRMTVTNRVNAARRCSLNETLEGSQVISSHSNVPGETHYPVTRVYMEKFKLSPVQYTCVEFLQKVRWLLVGANLPNFALCFELGQRKEHLNLIYIWQFGQIHLVIWTNTFGNFDKYFTELCLELWALRAQAGCTWSLAPRRCKTQHRAPFIPSVTTKNNAAWDIFFMIFSEHFMGLISLHLYHINVVYSKSLKALLDAPTKE